MPRGLGAVPEQCHIEKCPPKNDFKPEHVYAYVSCLQRTGHQLKDEI